MSAVLFDAAASVGIVSWAGHLVAVWLLGLTLGWLLPRPKWAKRKNVLLKTMPGLWLTRFMALFNGFLIVREIWYRFCQPGTFRAILHALWVSITEKKRFEWPSFAGDGIFSTSGKQDASSSSAVLPDSLRWYVSTADLQNFRDIIEGGAGPAWEQMLQKEWDGCTYTAWRRSLPSGRTEYKSVTVSEDATAQEFMDFYLDDDVRPKWDGMISEHQLLESAHDKKNRCQVVRWLRSFPFAFLSRREYVIARRLFPGDDPDTLYGITKSVEHPAAPPLQGIVRMSTFYSMWRSRTLPCPRGSGKPMCETTLLHFEDFGIPENLARFTVRHGMAGFVGKMVPEVKEFVKERRTRCGPYQQDPQAYGAGLTPIMRSGSGSIPSSPKAGGDAGAQSPPSEDVFASPSPSTGERGMLRSSSVRGFGYMLLASGVALALARTGSNPCLIGSSSSQAAGNREDDNEATGTSSSSLGGHNTGFRRSPFAQQLRKHLHHAKKHHRTHGGAGKHHHAHCQHLHHGHAAHSNSTGTAVAMKQRPHAVSGLRSHRVSHAEADA